MDILKQLEVKIHANTVLLFAILVIVVCCHIRLAKESDLHTAMLKETYTLLSERNYRDSLYRDHLKTCSFISNDEIEVGSNGVLFSKYHKKYN